MGYVHRSRAERQDRDDWIIFLRARGFSLGHIAKLCECSTETVREAIDPALKARRNTRRLARYHERRAGA